MFFPCDQYTASGRDSSDGIYSTGKVLTDADEKLVDDPFEFNSVTARIPHSDSVGESEE